MGVKLGGRNRYRDGWREKPLLGVGFQAPDQAAVKKMLALSLELEGTWVLIAFGLAAL